MNSFIQGELDFESGDVILTNTQYHNLVNFLEKLAIDPYAEIHCEEALELRDMLIVNKQMCNGTRDPENRDFSEED